MTGSGNSEVRSQDAGNEGVATLPPSSWQGEVDCVVGPFSSHKQARSFVNFEVGFDPDKAVVDTIFARGDTWYVELRKLRWA